MANRGLLSQIIAFLVACVSGLILALIGLRLYFNDARLQSELTQIYLGKNLKILAGKAKKENNAILVEDFASDGYSFINAGFLHIDPQFYERIEVSFDDIHPLQSLILIVRFEPEGTYAPKEPIVVERRVHLNDDVVTFSINDLKPKNKVIIDVGIISDKLLKPYQIKMIKIIPKKFKSYDFTHLLWDCFAINKKWENWSINTHKSPHRVLVPPKVLVFIVFFIVGVLFALYLWSTGRRVINAWWTTIVAAWLALDAHYLVEKTVITKNTYNTFAHLSDNEKDLVLSPEPAKLAQTIKSVLPKDGKPKKIWIQFGWKNRWALSSKESYKRYIDGKLRYYLLPHQIYTGGREMSVKHWLKGDFYFVDLRASNFRKAFNNHNYMMKYDKKKLQLNLSPDVSINAKRLVNSKNIAIYQVR